MLYFERLLLTFPADLRGLYGCVNLWDLIRISYERYRSCRWVRHSVVSDYEGGVEADAPSV